MVSVPPPRCCLLLLCPAWLALMICAEMRCNLLGSFPCRAGGRALGVTERCLPRGQPQLIQVTPNPGLAGAGRSLKAASHSSQQPSLPRRADSPNFSCRPGVTDGAGDFIHPPMGGVEATCREVTPLWEQLLWLPAALCAGWGRSAQIDRKSVV